MITKRPSINTSTLVLLIAAMLVILTVAIVSSLNPAVLSGSASIHKRVQTAGSSSQIQVDSNYDAHDYYMTHPRTQATANFDAHDYYMTHPKVQAVINLDAHDYYMTHPKGFDR